MSFHDNTVSLDGLALDSGDHSLVTVKVAGWDDAPESRLSMESRSQTDGAWDATGFFDKRVIDVDGAVVFDSAVDAHAFADTLLSFTPRSSYTFSVSNDAVGERSALVRVQRGAVLEWSTDCAFTYTLQLVAPDPLKYGPETFGQTGLSGVSGTGRVWPRVWPRDWGVPAGTTPGAIGAPNAGTAAYWPRLRIDGPVDTPVVTVNETGDWVRYNGSLATGQYLDIDCANRRVLLNGFVSKAPLVTFSGRWLVIPPGGASLSWNANSADPNARLSLFAREGAWS